MIRSTLRTSVALTPLLILASLASAQTVSDAPLMESVEVRVVSVDAVVTDRSGHRVRDLQPGDFELFENGRRQEISNFSEFKAIPEAAPKSSEGAFQKEAPSPAVAEQQGETKSRMVMIFLDEVSMPGYAAKTFFGALDDFLDRTIRPGDQVLIASWRNGFRVNVPFTTDREVLHRELVRQHAFALPRSERQELAELRREIDQFTTDGTFVDARSGFDAGKEIEFSRQSTADELWRIVSWKVNSLEALMTRVSGINARKVLLLVSQDLYFDTKELTMGGGGRPTKGIAGENSTFSLMQSLAATANAYDVTIHSMHPRGLNTSLPSADGSGAGNPADDYLALSNETRAIEEAAHMTGGTIAVGPAKVAAQFEEVREDLESYYSLGYRPSGKRHERKIELRMKNPAYTVRTRSSVVERTAEQQLQDKVIANLFSPIASPRFPVEARAGKAIRQGRTRTVPVEVRIPIDVLTLLPNGAKKSGGFTVLVAAANQKGDLSPVSARHQKLDMTDKQFQQLRGHYISYAFDLAVGDGPQQISLAVQDDLGRELGFARLLQ